MYFVNILFLFLSLTNGTINIYFEGFENLKRKDKSMPEQIKFERKNMKNGANK